jgi:hypothetical protein
LLRVCRPLLSAYLAALAIERGNLFGFSRSNAHQCSENQKEDPVGMTHKPDTATVRLKSENMVFAVDAVVGGRVVEFSLDGANVLCDTGVQIGSTFWPSPQSSWGWPPPAAMDSEPYQVTQPSDGGRATLTSAACPQTHLQLTKEFGVALAGEAVWLRYTLKNVGSRPRRVAHWEITRVPGGLTFYESAQPCLPISQGNMALEQGQGCGWYQYCPETLSQQSKIFAADSGGWLANVSNGLLFLKVFVPISASEAAPGEAELEIYAHDDLASPYIELEQQGPFRQIPPGGETHWTVCWSLTQLPAEIPVVVGSKQLLDYTHQQFRKLAETGLVGLSAIELPQEAGV